MKAFVAAALVLVSTVPSFSATIDPARPARHSYVKNLGGSYGPPANVPICGYSDLVGTGYGATCFEPRPGEKTVKLTVADSSLGKVVFFAAFDGGDGTVLPMVCGTTLGPVQIPDGTTGIIVFVLDETFIHYCPASVRASTKAATAGVITAEFS